MICKINRKQLPQMFARCSTCANLREKLCWASIGEFRLEEEIKSAGIADSEGMWIARLNSRAKLAARQVTLLRGHVQAHRRTHRIPWSSAAACRLATRENRDTVTG